MNRRIKLYPIAVIVIILAGILGSLGSIHVEGVYQSYYNVGYTECMTDIVPKAYSYGWQEGLTAGYAAGTIEGWRMGYKSGVFAVDSPYHLAALAFEKSHLWLDITLLGGNKDILVISLIVPETPAADYDPDQFDEEVVALLESVYDGQSIVRIFISTYDVEYQMHILYFAFDFEADSFFEYRLGEGTQGQTLIYYAMEMPVMLMDWPTNPYYDVQDTESK